MNEKNEIYQCDICGNLVSVLKGGFGELMCCGEKMIYLKPQTGDPASEKHIPFCKEEDGTIKVQTGKHLHAMVKSHYIGFMEAQSQNLVYRKYFKPGEKPEIELSNFSKSFKMRSYCLIHGVFEYTYKM